MHIGLSTSLCFHRLCSGIVCILIVTGLCPAFSHMTNALLISLHQMTPLHVAVKKARTEVVKFLVDKEADINIKDGNGVNICMWVNIFL